MCKFFPSLRSPCPTITSLSIPEIYFLPRFESSTRSWVETDFHNILGSLSYGKVPIGPFGFASSESPWVSNSLVEKQYKHNYVAVLIRSFCSILLVWIWICSFIWWWVWKSLGSFYITSVLYMQQVFCCYSQLGGWAECLEPVTLTCSWYLSSSAQCD